MASIRAVHGQLETDLKIHTANPHAAPSPMAIPWRAASLAMVTLLAGSPALAQAPAASPGVTTEVVAKGLQNAWAVAFIGDGRMLVTERPGRLRRVTPDGRVSAPVAGVPTVHASGQGGRQRTGR